jgi:pyruvate carboxylase
MPEILQKELPRVQAELGNWWSVTPGSQILWTTAVNNVLGGKRYKDANDDLKNLMLGRYGDLPFYKPSDDIYEAVFGPDWRKIVEKEKGYQKIDDIDLEVDRRVLEHRLGRLATDDEFVLYLQHPNDAVNSFKFEEKYGKTWVLPPHVWFQKGGFNLGEKFEFSDAYGKNHIIEIGSKRKTKTGDAVTYLIINHHPEPILTELEQEGEGKERKVTLSAKDIEKLAQSGDVRSPIKGTVSEIPVTETEDVSAGQILIVLEAMKMLSNIISEINGVVSDVLVSPGDEVDVGDPLIMVEKRI